MVRNQRKQAHLWTRNDWDTMSRSEHDISERNAKITRRRKSLEVMSHEK
jgi:hypothetical protein